MAFDFGKLPKSARRAAFAHMDAKHKATKAAKKTATTKKTPLRHRTSPKAEPNSTGRFAKVGTISREKAAEIMFGSAGAKKRIAKDPRFAKLAAKQRRTT